MADVKSFYKVAEDKMDGALLHLDDSFAHIRAGKANVRILDPIRVDNYGAMTPLSGVASITTPDARTIAIKPWDRKEIRNIEKAIMDSINRLHGKKTLIIIAHRLQTIEKCDMVYRVEDGKAKRER